MEASGAERKASHAIPELRVPRNDEPVAFHFAVGLSTDLRWVVLTQYQFGPHRRC